MIPILFEHSEADFISNGLGRLTEAASCKVTEELNGIYELELVYPVTGRHYDELTFGRIIYATHDDAKDPEPFDIYRKTAPLNGQVTVYARHISYRLNNIIVEPYDASSCTAVFAGIPHHSINPNPFTFLNTVSKTASFELNHPVSVRNLLCGTDSMSVPQLFGGEYEWKKFTVYHRAKRGRDTSIELRYGKNITDMSHDVDVSNTYGAVIPYWLSSDGTELAALPEWMVINQGSTSERVGLLDLSHEWDIYPEEEDLRDFAAQALQKSNIPDENLTVSFYELWQTEEYEQYSSLQRAFLGDDVKVVNPDLGIDTKLRVVKIVYNVLLDRYDSMELGKPSQPYASVIQQQVRDEIYEIAPTKSAMELAIEHATKLITGGLGGHLVIGTDENGNPNELLIMDTTDKATATNVLRLNLYGIGFSTSGYDGPFHTAWTIDSNFVADFITTGNLNASLLTTGVIQSNDGNIVWDLDAGTFTALLSKMSLMSKKTTEQGQEVDVTRTFDQVARDEVNLANVTNALTQMAVFNKLTNGGTIQGFFIDETSGEVYVNLSGLRADGFFEVKKGSKTVFSINANTGEVVIHPTTLTITADGTDQSIEDYVEGVATGAAGAIDTSVSDEDVLNVLTNNGQIKGIFMKEDGRLFINWSYARGGELLLGGTNNEKGYLKVVGGQQTIDKNYTYEYTLDKDGFSIFHLIHPDTQYESSYRLNLDVSGLEWKDGNYLMSYLQFGGFEQYLGEVSLASANGVLIKGSGISFNTTGSGNYSNYKNTSSTQAMEITGSQIAAYKPATGFSDRRAKENIKDSTVDYEKVIKGLHVVSFDWKDKQLRHVVAGFIAQEVSEVIPEIVYKDQRGLYSIEFNGIIPVLVGEAQRMQKVIDAQQKKIDELEARLAKIEELLASK